MLAPTDLRKGSLGNIQGQVGRGSEQPALVEGVPAQCRGIGLDDL